MEELYIPFSQFASIGDCAFCGLEKLKKVDLQYNHILSSIHENAFGAISNAIAPPVEYFSIWNCNISILPEKLLNWKHMNTMVIGLNPYACNCSMAWLIEDLQSSTSLYKKKIKNAYQFPGIIGPMSNMLYCGALENSKPMMFKNIPETFCNSTKHTDESDNYIYVCGDDATGIKIFLTMLIKFNTINFVQKQTANVKITCLNARMAMVSKILLILVILEFLMLILL